MEENKNIRKNEQVFKIPDNYFDEFQAKMSDADRISSPTSSFSRSKTLVRSAYLIPAMIVIIVIGMVWFTDDISSTSGLADVSTEDLITFLEEDGVTEEELLSYLGTSIDGQEAQLYGSDQLFDDLNTSELEDISDDLDLLNEIL